MYSSRSLLVLAALFPAPLTATVGCGGSTSANSTADSGTDGAIGSVDSGTHADSGSGHDTGTVTGADGGDASKAGEAGSPDSGGGGDAGSGGDAGNTLSPQCPATAPTAGSSCSTASLACEYGGDLFLSCDTLATCSAGSWQVQPPTSTSCSGATGGTTAGCPASSSAVPVGQACSPQMTCGYGDTVCYCYIDHTGAPQVWGCFPGTTGCPYPRPRVGSTCTSDGLQCDYSSCGDSIDCTAGLWTVGNGGCHP